jgi:hypothetical protein
MDSILAEIERSLGAGLFYSAILLSLTLPDICAALESPDGKSDGDRYMRWYDAHLARTYPQLTSIDCWSLRCGVAHQGRFGPATKQYSRVIFGLPNNQGITIHRTTVHDALYLDAVHFCRDFLAAVRTWLANAKVPDANMERLVRWRPTGLAPYSFGIPVIA